MLETDLQYNKAKCPEEEDISLKELIIKFQNWFKYICRQWALILIAVFLGSISGLIYSLVSKPLYKAELSFVLEDEKTGGLSTAAGLASQFGFDIGGSTSGAFSGDNLIELLKSRSMVEKTLLTDVLIQGKKESLAELYISFNNLRDKWKSDKSLQGLQFNQHSNRGSFTLKQDSLLGEFYKSLTKNELSINKEDKKLSIIAVKLSTENELFSKYFVENLVKNVSAFYIETKTKKESQNVSILQHQTDSVKKQLNLAISGVATSIDLNPNPNPSLQILRTPSQRRQFDVQANTAILTELLKNLELSKITLRKETPLIQIIDVPILPLDKVRLGKIKGIIIGGIISGLAIVIFMTLRLIYIRIMA